MSKIGILVRIKYPKYAENLVGTIIAQESPSRWIVKIEPNPLNSQTESLLLSLKESDFEVIDN